MTSNGLGVMATFTLYVKKVSEQYLYNSKALEHLTSKMHCGIERFKIKVILTVFVKAVSDK
jgi:hypothetical protein